MKRKTLPILSLALVLGVLLVGLSGAVGAQESEPQGSVGIQAVLGTAFTYQGRLNDDGSPANGTYDFEFKLYDDASGGSQVGSTVPKDDATVTDGLFTVELDFGSGAFDGDARWLEIGVRPGSSTGAYTTLTPRQTLTPAPYALALPGLWTQPNATSPNIIGGYSGNSVTDGVIGATISGGGNTPGYYEPLYNSVTDNFGTVSGGENNQAGNNSGTIQDAPHATVGGGASNYAQAYGATIGGGSLNVVNGRHAAVCGGFHNAAQGNSSTISGGEYNSTCDNCSYAAIGGGIFNSANTEYAAIGGGEHISVMGQAATVAGGSWITVTGDYAAVGGGATNTASDKYATVSGGHNNEAIGYAATIGGGEDNTATGGNGTSGSWATVGGGRGNEALDPFATVGGGSSNKALDFGTTVGGGIGNKAGLDDTPDEAGRQATVGGGGGNEASGDYATVPGGFDNTAAGDYSFAAGRYARANHDGSFVWADSTIEDYESFYSNTFQVRANGGVFFNDDLVWDPTNGLNADLLDGQDSSAFAPAAHTHAWSDLTGVPADLADGDDDTLANLSCGSGQVAKWNGSTWVCGTDDTTPIGDDLTLKSLTVDTLNVAGGQLTIPDLSINSLLKINSDHPTSAIFESTANDYDDPATLVVKNEGDEKRWASLIVGYDSVDDPVFRVRANGMVYGTFIPDGADFAEMLPAVEGLEPGDVLVINPDGKLTHSTQAYQPTIVGVYSTRPGFLGGASEDADLSGKIPLAVLGVVPVKASAENGPIQPGDLLTASSTPGHAMKAGPNPPIGTVLGKALEGLDEGTGVILMLVTLQ